MDPKSIREKFLVDESQIDTDQLRVLEGRVAFDQKGRVVVRESGQYRDRDKVALFAAGWNLAHDAGTIEKESFVAADAANGLDLDEAVVNARLSDLCRDGLIDRSGRGQYRARLARIVAAFQPKERAVIAAQH